MMQPIVFKVLLFAGPDDRARSQTSILWLLEALCKIDQGHLATHKYPPLYKAGVRYKRENGTEEWLDIPHVIAAGVGDCEDLACWRVAELRQQGIKASPYAKWRRIKGVYHYHAMVKRFDHGKPFLEDPSRKLGMGSPEDRAYARQIAAEAKEREAARGRGGGAERDKQPDNHEQEAAPES
jgi:hypothetical protein